LTCRPLKLRFIPYTTLSDLEINVGDANDINKSLIIRDNGASWDTDTNVVITGHRVNLSQPNSKTLLNLDKVHLEDNIIIVKEIKDRKSTRLNSSHVKISYAV